MIAKVTQPTELGPLRTLPMARHAGVERGIGLSPGQHALPSIDCRRRSSSCCHPKLVPVFNESGKLVPTSRRWGHHQSPVSAGLFLWKQTPEPRAVLIGHLGQQVRWRSHFSAQPRSDLSSASRDVFDVRAAALDRCAQRLRLIRTCNTRSALDRRRTLPIVCTWGAFGVSSGISP